MPFDGLWGFVCNQNVCVVTLVKSPRPAYPSLSTLLSSHGERGDGINRCSSSVWKRLSTNANASGIYKILIVMERGGFDLSPLVMSSFNSRKVCPQTMGMNELLMTLYV